MTIKSTALEQHKIVVLGLSHMHPYRGLTSTRLREEQSPWATSKDINKNARSIVVCVLSVSWSIWTTNVSSMHLWRPGDAEGRCPYAAFYSLVRCKYWAFADNAWMRHKRTCKWYISVRETPVRCPHKLHSHCFISSFLEIRLHARSQHCVSNTHQPPYANHTAPHLLQPYFTLQCCNCFIWPVAACL